MYRKSFELTKNTKQAGRIINGLKVISMDTKKDPKKDPKKEQKKDPRKEPKKDPRKEPKSEAKKKRARRRKSIEYFLKYGLLTRYLILGVVMAVFTVVLYPNLVITEHEYKLGDVVNRDIKASRDFFFEDEAATEMSRRKAVKKVLTVYDYDAELVPEAIRRVTAAFEKMRVHLENERLKSNGPGNLDSGTLLKHMESYKEEFENDLGFPVDKDTFRVLVREEFSPRISNLIIRIVTEILNNGVVANKEFLLQESDTGIVLRTVGTESEKVVYTLKQFYGTEQAKTMVRVIAQPIVDEMDLHYSVVNLVVDFCKRLIRPNITLNRNETEERKKNAREEIKPILYKIKAGEMLLRNGEVVTETQLMKLKALNARKKKDKPYIRAAGALLTIVCLVMVLYYLHALRHSLPVSVPNKDALFIAIILIIFICLPKMSSVLFNAMSEFGLFRDSGFSFFYGMPMAAGAMLTALFLGIDVAVSVAIIIAVCTSVIFQNRFDVFIFFLLNGLMAGYWIQDCRERKVFVKAGLKLGALNIVLALAIDIFMGEFSGLKLPIDILMGFLGGIIAGILAAGLTPMFEIAFDYTTDITLLELANLERPLLRRLMLEAPGTYHHSVIVGSMVEAAASEIGANPLLAKVCGYYHDVGKLKKPLYFVENQMDGINRHDKLAPSMSSLILISHVKHGVEFARRKKLGKVIIDTIQQHHGTSLIKFFYEKAKKLRGEDAVKIDDFRYPGPKPQTREAGLVMLADAVEASSRTLENPTPSRIQGHVQKMINGIFSDGQLDDCELTLRDLHSIAKSFNKILNGIHHHRIEYPEKTSAQNGKDKNTRQDQQPSGKQQGKDAPKKTGDTDSSQLKRLGIS